MKRIFPLLMLFCFTLLSLDALAVEPTVQAYNIAFSNVGQNQLRLAFTRGNGTYRIVVAKQTSDVSTITDPADGEEYTANASFGTGSDIGDNSYVVYSGTGRAVTITSLSAGLPYSFHVYEFNGVGTSTDYLLSDAANNPRYTYTKPAAPSNANSTDITDVSFVANWDQPGEGDWDGYELQVATDADFNNLLEDYNPAELGIDLDPNPYYMVEDLSANTTYYWRVRSKILFRYSDWVSPESAVTTTPEAPTIENMTVCQGSTATLTPTAPDPENNTFRFYDAKTEGTLLGEGASYTTDELTETTTYYVSTVNNNTGLESSTRTAVTVTVESAPVPDVSGEETVCANTTGSVYSTAMTEGNTYLWTITGGTITEGDNTNEITVTWGEAGTAQLILAESTSAGCTGYDTVNVTIQDAPTPEISGTANVCANDENVTYSVPEESGTSFDWTVEGGTITEGNNTNLISVTWNGEGSGRVWVTVANDGGCTGSDTMDVTIQPYPVPAISGGDTIVCANTENVTYMTEATDNTFLWTITGGTIVGDSTANSVTVNWGEAGTGTLSVVETSSAGCATESIVNVTIQAIPTPVISGDSIVCANESAVVYSTTMNEGNTYLWTATGGTIEGDSTLNSVTINWGEAGTGTISLTETTSAGCEGTASTFNVTVQALPEPDISGSDTVCANAAEAAYSITGSEGDTYLWMINGGTISGDSTGASVTINWGGAGTGRLIISETTTGGCVTYDTLDITIVDSPSPSVSGNEVVCANSTENVYTTTMVDGNTYAWAITGGTITAGDETNEVTVTWDEAGTGTLILTESNAGGCSVSDTVNVTIEAIPAPVISGQSQVCENEEGSTFSTPDTGNDFVWEVSGGEIVDGQGTRLITVNWGEAGTGTVVVTETTSAGCSTVSDTFSVEIQAPPVPEITGSDNVCANQTDLVYSVASTENTIDWTVTGGTIVSGQSTNEITVMWDDTTTTGQIMVSESSEIGCSGTATLNITVYPVPDAAIEGSNTVCASSTGSVYSSMNDNDEGNTYAWSVTGGTITSGDATASITVDWGEAGTGSVMLTLTSEQGCSSSDTLEVTIESIPAPEISGSMTVCANTTDVEYSTPSTDNTYEWSVTGGTIQGDNTGNTIVVNWGEAGNGTIIVSETTTSGCTAYDTVQVTVESIPAPSISGSINVCANDTMAVYSTASTDNTFAWTLTGNGTIVGESSGNTLTVNWGEAGTATLIVTETTSAGCSTSDTLDVTVNSLPTPEITGNTTVCVNSENVEYSVVTVEGNTYDWTVTGGNVVSGAGTGTVMINWGSDLTGSVMVTETNAAGCSAQATVDVTLQAYPAPSITGPSTVVEDSTYTYSTTENEGNTYAWTVTGGTVVSGENTSSIEVTWGSAGSGSVSVTESSSAGCSTTASIDVTIRGVNDPFMLAIIDSIGRQVSGTPFNITVQAQTSNGTPANVTSDTPISISVSTGSGTVTGSGTITAGSNQTTISVAYENTSGETGVVLMADDGPGGLNSGLSNAFTVLAQEPMQASSIVWDAFDTTSITLSWTNGAGTGRLVLAKQTTSFTSGDNPSDGVSYTADPQFGSGSQVGNAYAVYNGTGNSVSVTGLTRNTRYWFKVYEYNGADSTINYNINAVTGNPRSRFTAPRMPIVDDQFPTASEGGLIYMSNFMPNPASDRVNFNIQLGEGQNVTVTLMTLSGQTVAIPVNGAFYEGGQIHNINIPISNLAAGTYIVTVAAGDEIVMDKVMIIH